MNPKYHNIPKTVLSVGIIIFAVSLHILTDVDINNTKLRIGVSDIFLPFLLLFFMLNNIKAISNIFNTNRLIRISLIITTLWLLVSVINGRIYMENWQTWALVNKTVGWFVLLGYFICGYFIAEHGQKIRNIFIQSFFIAAWLIGIYSICRYALFLHGIIDDTTLKRLAGFFANPNAFGFIMAVVFILHIPFMYKKKYFPQWIHVSGSSVILVCIFLSGSRSAALGLLFAIPIMIYLRQITWAMVYNLVCLTLLIGTIAFHGAPTVEKLSITGLNILRQFTHDEPIVNNSRATKKRKAKRLYALRHNNIADSGMRYRTKLAQRSIELWRDKPVFGIGIGSFYWDQFERNEIKPNVIHNSALWILTEMGIIGMLIFLFLFYSLIRVFWINKDAANDSHMFIGMIGVILVFAGMSVGTEALYQRYLWVLLGITVSLADQIDRMSYSKAV